MRGKRARVELRCGEYCRESSRVNNFLIFLSIRSNLQAVIDSPWITRIELGPNLAEEE